VPPTIPMTSAGQHQAPIKAGIDIDRARMDQQRARFPCCFFASVSSLFSGVELMLAFALRGGMDHAPPSQSPCLAGSPDSMSVWP